MTTAERQLLAHMGQRATTTIHEPDAEPEIEQPYGERPIYVIRDTHQNAWGEVKARCGNVRVGFTFSTRGYFWDGGFFGYVPRYRCVN